MDLDEYVLSGLKTGRPMFVTDYILGTESRRNDLDAVAKEIAERNDLRWARLEENCGYVRKGYVFTRIE